MTLWDLRQHIESAIPLWAYFGLLGLAALIGFVVGFSDP